MSISDVTLDQAVLLLSLPRLLGPHPETGEPVTAGVGLFGPFVAHQGVFASIAAKSSGWTPFTVTLDAAMELFAKKAVRVAAREAKGLPAFSSRKSASKVKLPSKKGKSNSEAVTAPVVVPPGIRSTLRIISSDKKGLTKVHEPARDPATQQRGRVTRESSTNRAAGVVQEPVPAVQASLKKPKVLQEGSDSRPDPESTRSLSEDKPAPVAGRSVNPYLQFSALNRQRLKDLNPTAKPTELMSLLASEWRGLGQSEREQYRASPVKGTSAGIVGAGAEVVMSARSTRSQNPYLQFSAVNRKRIKEQHPAAKPSEVMSLLASEWRGLDDSQRAMYKSSAGNL